MRTTLLFLATLAALGALAQDTGRAAQPVAVDSLHKLMATDSVRPGIVAVHESPAIAALMAEYAAREHPLKGYRVQLFTGDRSTAEDTRRSFLLKHPDIPAYLSYLAPNFRVRAGDLRDRLAAEKLHEELSSDFPGSYVVPDDIEWPRLPVPEPGK